MFKFIFLLFLKLLFTSNTTICPVRQYMLNPETAVKCIHSYSSARAMPEVFAQMSSELGEHGPPQKAPTTQT